MTVSQSVCSYGHTLPFGDVSRLSTPVTRSRENNPSFRMPHDGVPGEFRDAWVQLLKTGNGLADGTRE